MEKKRRARINVSLEQLKSLLEKHYSHQIRKRKLEKADILELSVKYMKSLQNSVQGLWPVPGGVEFPSGFRSGLPGVSQLLRRGEEGGGGLRCPLAHERAGGSTMDSAGRSPEAAAPLGPCAPALWGPAPVPGGSGPRLLFPGDLPGPSSSVPGPQPAPRQCTESPGPGRGVWRPWQGRLGGGRVPANARTHTEPQGAGVRPHRSPTDSTSPRWEGRRRQRRRADPSQRGESLPRPGPFSRPRTPGSHRHKASRVPPRRRGAPGPPPPRTPSDPLGCRGSPPPPHAARPTRPTRPAPPRPAPPEDPPRALGAAPRAPQDAPPTARFARTSPRAARGSPPPDLWGSRRARGPRQPAPVCASENEVTTVLGL
ncbi:transcription factor HES-3 isoform X1 [Canis lupus familiaris]|nr:transcription factor HES-3 isoform X1 [Canis lupus familiaris]